MLATNDTIKNYFDIDDWQINQPIILSNLQNQINAIEGVISVSNLTIVNKYKTADGYGGNVYDMSSANKNGIIYPALDPSIFELKYPMTDIVGSVVGGETTGGGY